MEVEQQEEVKKEVVEQTSQIVETYEDDLKRAGFKVDETQEVQETKEDLQTPKVDETKAVEETKEPKKSRAQRKIERQNQRIKDLELQINTQETKPVEVKVDGNEPEPEDFEDYDDYEKALEVFNKPSKKPEPEAEEKTDTALETRIAEMREDGVEDYPDFDDLISAPDLALSQAVLNEVLDSDNPSDIAYYLATHKDKTKEIAKMSKKQIQKELMKIEIGLENKPGVKETKKTTQAPEPINPIEGSNSPDVRNAKEATSYTEFERLRTVEEGNNGW